MSLLFISRLSHMSLHFIYFFFKASLSLQRSWYFRVWQDVWICSITNRTTVNAFAMLIHFCLLQCLPRSSVLCSYQIPTWWAILILQHSLYHNCFCAQCVYFPGKHTVCEDTIRSKWTVHFCAQEMWHLRFARFTACTKTVHIAG